MPSWVNCCAGDATTMRRGLAVDDIFRELRVIESFFIFVGFAVMFSLMKSFLHINLGMEWAITIAAIFFMANLAKVMYEGFL